MPPDPKGPPRIVDRMAMRRVLLADRACAACGRTAVNAHHVIPKGERGDDVVENLLPICGSGTMHCHGALHGNPYTVEVLGPTPTARRDLRDLPAKVMERRDREWVARRLGARIAARPDILAYVHRKLGEGPGDAYLARVYYLAAEAV